MKINVTNAIFTLAQKNNNTLHLLYGVIDFLR